MTSSLATTLDSKVLDRGQGVGIAFVSIFVISLLLVFFINTVNAFGWVGKTFPGFLVNERMVVSGVGNYTWTGPQAGVKYPDRLLAVNGEPVSSMGALLDRLARHPPGTSLTYSIRQQGEQKNISIPSMRFGWSDFAATYGVTAFAAAFYLITGIVVFILKPNTLVSWIFFGVCYILSVYSLLIFDISAIHSGFIRLYITANGLLPASFVHFGMYFPKKSGLVEKHPWVQVIPYIVALALIIPVLVLYPDDSAVRVWYGLLAYMIIGAFSIVLPVLLEFLRPSSPLARQRAKVVLFGAALAFPLPAILYFTQTYFGSVLGNRVNSNFLALPLLVFPAAIGYSIARHNLFDVDVYIKRTVGYLIMTVILAGGYLSLQSAVRYMLIEPVFGNVAEHIYPVLYAILVVFLFNPVNTWIQSLIDKLFYRKEFDFREVIQNIEVSLASVLDINERIKRLVNNIKETLFLESTGVVVYDSASASGKTYFEISSGEDEFEVFKTSEFRIRDDNPLVQLIIREGKLLTRFDLEEDKRYSHYKHTCIDHFDNLDAIIGVPLIHNDDVMGVLFLGGKRSGKFYTKQDIDLVRMLSARGAVAIDNARLVEKMKKEEAVRGNLARYLSPQIVDRVVSEGVELDLGGQRKEVSVLFSDIRGFTTISETWPPDQLVTILNEYMTEMVAVVFENKGSIDKFVGDAIVAVFGSLVEVDNHAQHAVEGALGMLQRLPALNRKWQKEYGVGLNIGAGINSGEVFLGNIGSPDRMEFTVIGDAVNLAARLEGLTKFYSVELVISEFTHRKLEDILCRKLDLVQVKGKNKAVAIYEPVCLGRDASDDLRAELASYEEALAAYYDQQWDKASGVFNVLCSEHPDRNLYQLYLERIQNLRNAGLPEDWDGVFVHTSK